MLLLQKIMSSVKIYFAPRKSLFISVFGSLLTWFFTVTVRPQSVIILLVLLAGVALWFQLRARGNSQIEIQVIFKRKHAFNRITILSSLLALGSVIVRNALNLFDEDTNEHFRNGVIPSFLFDSSHPAIVVYDKSAVKQIILHFSTCFLLFSSIQIFYGLRFREFFAERAKTANLLLGGVIIFCSWALPPYTMDFPHWSSWLGPALQIDHGKLPIIASQSQYGFWPPLILYVWTKVFGTSINTFVLLIFLLNSLSAFITYKLILRFTGKAWLALFGVFWIHIAFFPNVNESTIAPNLGPIRNVLPALITLFSFAQVAYAKTEKPFWYFCLGLVTLWEPATGFFSALAFLAFIGFKGMRSGFKSVRFPLGYYALGSIGPISIALLLTKHEPIFKIISDTIDHYRLYGDGFGNVEQSAMYYEIIFAMFLLFSIQYVIMRGFSGRMTPRPLLMLTGIILVIPFIMQNFSRTYNNMSVVIWILLPLILGFMNTYFRLPRFRTLTALSFLAFFSIVPNMGQPASPVIEKAFKKIGEPLVKYEKERYNWALKCSELIRAGKECGVHSSPSLSRYLAAGRASFYAISGEESMEVSILGKACQEKISIVSLRDILVYHKYHCEAPGRFNSFNLVLTKNQLSEYINLVTQGDWLIHDTTLNGYPTDNKQAYVAKAFQNKGYHISEVCGKLNIYRKESAPLTQKNFCGSSTQESSKFNLPRGAIASTVVHKAFSKINGLGVDLGKVSTVGDFSIEILLKPNEKQVANAHILGNHGNASGFALQSRQDNLYYFVYGIGGSFQFLEGIKLDPKKFSYLVIAKRNNLIVAYVNGKKMAVLQLNTTQGTDSGLNCFLGNWELGSRQFEGEIREIRISSKSINEADILANSRITSRL
jgi:hypothetical protein